MKRGSLIGGLLVLGFVTLAAGAARLQTQTFKLHEISVFKPQNRNFLRGQMGLCQKEPFTEVKVYPAFASQKPVYGSICFGKKYDDPNSGQLFFFAVDESGGTGEGYDRLYFDLNRDLNLKNDPVGRPQRNPPGAARLKYSNIKQQVLFGFLDVDFDFGPAGTRPVQLMPRLVVSLSGDEEYPQMTFVRTHLQEGDINIGGQEFTAWLGNDYVIFGRLDEPSSALFLSKKGASSDGGTFGWWGGERLMAMHKFDNVFFGFSANPTGTELMVHPYLGDMGTFEIGAGQRGLDKLTVAGSLRSQDRAVAAGEVNDNGSPNPVTRCQLPVGDYLPNYLSIRLGRLQISISYNYHSDGKPRDRGDRPLVYGFAVRKDQPFILDFSNKPGVMFASPGKDQRIKVGEELEVKAVLIDPQLDFMIRRLDDTSRKQTKTADGQPLNYERNLSLDPTVVVTRANGDQVAEGVMPFG